MKLGNFYTDIKIFRVLHLFKSKLCSFKVLKICQILHANMKGFRRASHICIHVLRMLAIGMDNN